LRESGQDGQPGIVGRLRSSNRAGSRFVLVAVTLGLVLAAAVVTAEVVARHVEATATSEATHSAETVVRGFVDPLLTAGALQDPGSAGGAEINETLRRLVEPGTILRIKIWGHDDTVVFSDLPELRGRTFEVEEDLSEALDGEVASEMSDGTAAENLFEHGLVDRFLEIYLPIRAPSGEVVAAYEIYQDAAPIMANIEATRRDVFLIAGAVALFLALVLLIGFDGTSRRLGRQNRRLRELTDSLRDSEARFRSLAQNASDLVLVVDRDSTVRYVSVSVERLLGFAPEDLVGRVLGHAVHTDDRDMLAQQLASLAERPGGDVAGESRVAHRDGRWRVFEWTARNLMDEPSIGGFVINAHDVTERADLEAQLTHQAFHDPLTGLANRALFADRVEHSLARRRRHRARPAVLFLDLDDFKTVNDTLGYGSGDRLLVEISRRLTGCLRPGDTACRVSGDEFAILLEEIGDVQRALEVADRILERVAEPVDIGRDVSVTASIGVVLVDDNVDDADDVLARADVAMYAAKAAGKGRHQLYEPAMRDRAWSRLELEGELRRAIDKDQIVVVYQPILDLRTREPVEMEALVRWDHPERGRLVPADFLVVAEESGLIVPLGRIVLERACQQASEWRRRWPNERPIDVSVNLSSRQFGDPGLLEAIRTALATADLPPSNLKLEITESAMLDADASDLLMRRIHDLGVRLAVDDFGTGFSGLSYFQRFPLDTLKIDRSFVSGLGRDPRSDAIVHATIAFAKALGLTVTAEGIETEDQFEHLRGLGADLGQGHLFAHPLEPAAADAYLVATRSASAA
jgi:diguanylate cyclase (GGDEF)-like protein/PAS domain S-box-containing protein